jgi:hypothetical protein
MFEQQPEKGTAAEPVPVSDSAAAAEVSPCWAEVAPGPETIAALAALPLTGRSPEELLDVLSGWERASSWLEAQKVRA